MRHPIPPLRQALAAWAVRVRRYRNWRAGAAGHAAAAAPATAAGVASVAAAASVRARSRGSGWMPAVLALLLAGAGGAVIASHALRLAVADDTDGVDSGVISYRDVLPGAVIDVPGEPGAHVMAVAGGAVLALNRMQGQEPVRISLCSQLRADGRLQALRISGHFDELAARGAPWRHALLAARDVPAVRVDGADDAATPLRLSWRGPGVAWVSDTAVNSTADGGSADAAMTSMADSGTGQLRRQGWLSWRGGALRIERRATAACAKAGELVVQLYRPMDEPAPGVPAQGARSCLVTAFSARGDVRTGWLPPGRHAIPVAADGGRHAQEDQALFAALQAHGLLRLAADGAIEVAPRDLLAWMEAAPQDRAASAAPWQGVVLDGGSLRLLKRLYRQADGAYVLRQIDIYNSERTLLAWRTAGDASQAGDWQMLGNGAPLPSTGAMPGAAARLFADLPQGWSPWRRVAGWPQGTVHDAGYEAMHAATHLSPFTLQHAATSGPLRLMVAGDIGAVRGARVTLRRGACTGTGCAAPDEVTELWLEPDGAGPVTVAVRPLPATVAAGDVRYRHVDIEQGKPIWRALGGSHASASAVAGSSAPDGAHAATARRPQPVRILDRSGALLWADGATVREARGAGLSAMLGVAPEHASGVAGMLARIPGGGPQTAALTLDLPVQEKAQAIVECMALRRGRWDGAACQGGSAPPPGRQAGMVLLDAHSGEILAAAGAGNAPAGPHNWQEVRAFDRANPARSPLRIPAWQHDGGIHRSPGSTFKVVSALGLELAARGDRQLDALLDGMAPADINRMAHARGYDFGTAAPAYPVNGRARITNYHEQGLEHRAQDGRLGLRQALAYSQNTWFAWAAEWSDRSLLGQPEGGMPDVLPLEPGALDGVRPVMAAARKLGFGAPMRLDGGLLGPDFRWSAYDALQSTPSHIDPVQTRHEVRQMAIGLRMQATPLQMAVVSGAIGEGALVAPRLLQALNGRTAPPAPPAAVDVRLDRIRAGMKGVIDSGTAAGAFGGAALAGIRRGLYGKTGTAPTGDGTATVWFTGWLEPGTLPGQAHRLAFAIFVSHSEASGGEHAAPAMAALLAELSLIGGTEGKTPSYPLK